MEDLITYAECKNASFDSSNSHGGNHYLTSDSDQWNVGNNQLAIPAQNRIQNQNYRQNFDHKKDSYRQPSYNKQSFGQNSQQNQLFANQNVSNNEKINANEKILSFGQKKPNFSKRNEPIKGQAMFNNTLVNYMCDSGADVSIINESTFWLIKRHDPETMLERHIGGKLYSATNEILVLGVIRLKRCLIFPQDELKNIPILVTENVSGYECLLGRDIIDKIPALKQQLDSIKNVVRMFSSGVMKIFKSEIQQ
jgi:hypothetical protein